MIATERPTSDQRARVERLRDHLALSVDGLTGGQPVIVTKTDVDAFTSCLAALDAADSLVKQCEEMQVRLGKQQDEIAALRAELADGDAALDDAILVRDNCTRMYDTLRAELDSLQLALDAERHNHRKDNEYLMADRDPDGVTLCPACSSVAIIEPPATSSPAFPPATDSRLVVKAVIDSLSAALIARQTGAVSESHVLAVVTAEIARLRRGIDLPARFDTCAYCGVVSARVICPHCGRERDSGIRPLPAVAEEGPTP